MIYPNTEVFAHALFEEAIRHLEDAHVLHSAGRLPGAITSSMKAAELGFKSVLILEGAFGWWENVIKSHSPVTDASGHLALGRVVSNFDARVVSRIKEMERLAPSQIGKKAFSNQDERNPEYPFVLFDGTNVGWVTPAKSFADPLLSSTYYNAAQDLLMAAAVQYATVGGWGLAVPPAL